MIGSVSSRAVPPHRAAEAALAAGALAAALVAGCSAGGGGEPDPGDPRTGAAMSASPGAEATSDAARTGDPPEFHGARALAVRPAREVFVQPSCTPDTDGQRLCWEESADPLRPEGPPAAVTLTDAVMRLDDLGLDWSVRLTFADDQPLVGAAGAVAGAGEDGRVLLLGSDTNLLQPLPAAAVTGRVVTLTDLEKDEAWDLVALVGGD